MLNPAEDVTFQELPLASNATWPDQEPPDAIAVVAVATGEPVGVVCRDDHVAGADEWATVSDVAEEKVPVDEPPQRKRDHGPSLS
jgi:hypothetical protein